MKKLTSKIARQFGGYYLMKTDLMFCRHVFSRAADIATPVVKKDSTHEAFDSVAAVLTTADPLLRAGGTLASEISADDPLESDRRAFFEAGIVAYAKCFNSNLRTRLPDGIFQGALRAHKPLHAWMMEVRNSHIAHSDLRLERSYAGIQLVDDPNYGKRPSGILCAILTRRNVPRTERLREMARHCDLIISLHLNKQISKVGKEIREQILRLPKHQFEELPNYFGELSTGELPDDHIWIPHSSES
jgi:hypothetical protein